MIDPDLEKYAKRLGTGRDDVRSLLVIAGRSPDGARIAKSVLRAQLRRQGQDSRRIPKG